MVGTTAFMTLNPSKYQAIRPSHLRSAVLSLALSIPLSACSSSNDEPSTDGAAGAPGASPAAKAGSSAGAGGAGGHASGGQSGDKTRSDAPVGYFTVSLVPPDDNNASGRTTLLGKVNDGPTPAAVVWTPGPNTDGCHLSKPRVPFCNTPCGGTAVCIEDDVCQPYPTALNVGTVHVTGVKTAAGASDFSMQPIANSYQAPAGTQLAYPAFEPADAIKFEASGGSGESFSLSAKGVAPLALTSGDLSLQSGQALHLAWTAGNADLAQIHVKLDISHHGGSKGMIECDTTDDGTLDIPAALMTDLLALGVAGYPTIIVTRQAQGSATITPGTVTLTVSSQVETPVTVPGLVSCGDDTDCPTGKTCQKDLSCSK
jgi:hypothetical protein